MTLFDPGSFRGMTIAEKLTYFVAENGTVSAVFVFTYCHPPLLQDRLVLSAEEEAILQRALALRKASSLPFWEALMLSCFGESGGYTRLLREATFHQPHKGPLQRISRDEVVAGGLVQRAGSPPPGENLSFASLVEVKDAGLMHLPLLDFHCCESDGNDRLVAEACKEIFGPPASVFASGESYHAVGLRLVDEPTMRDLLARSLLLSPIVDARYVAHQLLDGVCALRLSRSAEKPREPRLKFSVD